MTTQSIWITLKLQQNTNNNNNNNKDFQSNSFERILANGHSLVVSFKYKIPYKTTAK